MLSAALLSIVSCKKELSSDRIQSAATTHDDAVVAKIPVASVTSPADGANATGNLIDGKTATVWSGDNKNVYPPDPNSMYALLNLGSTLQTISYIKMAFDVNTQHNVTYSFDIQVSQDGATGWVTVAAYQHNGLNNPNLQTFDFPDTRGRYVRIMGHGNNGSSPKANRWAEVEVYGWAATASSAARVFYDAAKVTADNTIFPYVAANIADGNLTTNWASRMIGTTDYKSVVIDLGGQRLIDYVNASFYTGGDPQRMTRFSISTSSDSVNWKQAISNTWSALDAYAKGKLETFDIPDVNARFVRITCYGHTGTYSPTTYNSINEVEVYALPLGSGPLRIKSIIQHGDGDYMNQRTGTFYYNAQGNIERVVFSKPNVGGYEWDTYTFKYNDQNQVAGYYSDGTSLHINDIYSPSITYSYRNGKIVKQNLYEIYGDPITIDDSVVYDAQGRVAADYRITLVPLPIGDPEQIYDTSHYTYNAAGNRVFPGPNRIYDNHPSFLRTDPFLMFMTRDYSMNNPVGATAYSPQGYPTQFAPNSSSRLPFQFFSNDQLSSITYGPAY